MNRKKYKKEAGAEKSRGTGHNRTEVLSVKASVAEKYLIVQAAKQYKMPYSEFVRYVVLNACSTMGIETPEGVTSEDVRTRRSPRRGQEMNPSVDESVAA